MLDSKASDGEGKKENRQALIVWHLQQHHYISIEEIASRFAVTTQTARRDVMALEEAGLVRRLHGGATIASPIDPAALRQRRVDNAAQKTRIAEHVADLVTDGAVVFLDTGTTCEAVAAALVKRRGLRIVTYSLRSATLLSEHATFTVAVPGGFVRAIDGGVFQEDTAAFIKKFKYQFAIISVSGIDEEGDMCDDDHAEVAIVSAAMAQSEQTILAVDSSKFGRQAMVKLGSLADIDVLITDARPTGRLLKNMKQAGVKIVI